jgi:hypothetical protein
MFLFLFLFLFVIVIDDAMVQLLDPNKPDERERLFECFLLGFG